MKKTLRLTSTVQKGGCAAKVAATELRNILSRVQFPQNHVEVLVDGQHFDDAAIYKINDEVALVQTIDFFTPIVDSPYLFGKVAAANALSDVYAMGGRPKTALAVLAVPLATLSNEVIAEILQGACDVIKEAHACLVGGHSIDDETLKFGLAVTGLVDPQKIWTNTGARPGDALILTKALGTGTCTAALKRDLVSEDEISETISSMTTLNNVIDFLSDEQLEQIHAATDITGFGLSGHAQQMAVASQVIFEIEANKLPVLPRAQEFLEKEILTKAHRTNREYTQARMRTEQLASWQNLLLHDPQTSGGLLLAVDPSAVESIAESLKVTFPNVSCIGRVFEIPSHESTDAAIVVR